MKLREGERSPPRGVFVQSLSLPFACAKTSVSASASLDICSFHFVEVFLSKIFEHHQIITKIFHKEKLGLLLLFWGGKKSISVFFVRYWFLPQKCQVILGNSKNDTRPSSKCLRMKRFSEPKHHIYIYHQPPETLKYSEIQVCLYKTTMAKPLSPIISKDLCTDRLYSHDFALMPTNPAKNWKRLDMFGIFGKEKCTKIQ